LKIFDQKIKQELGRPKPSLARPPSIDNPNGGKALNNVNPKDLHGSHPNPNPAHIDHAQT